VGSGHETKEDKSTHNFTTNPNSAQQFKVNIGGHDNTEPFVHFPQCSIITLCENITSLLKYNDPACKTSELVSIN